MFTDVCKCFTEKSTVVNSAIQYRRPEFYSLLNQSICVDDSTYETLLCKSVQAFVKACIFLFMSKLVSSYYFLKDLLLNIGPSDVCLNTVLMFVNIWAIFRCHVLNSFHLLVFMPSPAVSHQRHLFLYSLCVCSSVHAWSHSEQLVNVSHTLLEGILPNLLLRCIWGQRWTYQNLRSKVWRLRLWRDQIWSEMTCSKINLSSKGSSLSRKV